MRENVLRGHIRRTRTELSSHPEIFTFGSKALKANRPMPHHDVVVLGAGPGGYVAAIRAAQLGLGRRSSSESIGSGCASTSAVSH